MREMRQNVCNLELREEQGTPPRLVGYAAIYDSRSEDLGGFREQIAPGAFDRALNEGHDVVALLNHNPDLLLARTPTTLRLSSDKRGLRVEMDLDVESDEVSRRVLSKVKRGDLRGMSFAFQARSEEWDHTTKPLPTRTLTDCDLFDVSVVVSPAYQATQVSARALDQAKQAPPPPAEADPNALLRMRLDLAARE